MSKITKKSTLQKSSAEQLINHLWQQAQNKQQKAERTEKANQQSQEQQRVFYSQD